MALNRSMSNIVIGFDDEKGVAEIFVNNGGDFRKATIEQFKIDKGLIKAESKVYDTLNLVLSAFISGKELSQPDVYVVLPDYYITMDLVTLPYMQKSKMKDALRAELRKLYVNFDELEFNSSIFSKNKKQVVFSCTFVKKSVLMQIASVMKRYNLNLRNVSFKSNACVNSFFALGGKMKHSSLIFANIYEDSASLISINKDKLINFLPLGFGSNILCGNRRVYESEVKDNTVSEFLRYNAMKSGNGSHKVELDYKDDFIEQFKLWQKGEHKRQDLMDDYAWQFESQLAENGKAERQKEALAMRDGTTGTVVEGLSGSDKAEQMGVAPIAVSNASEVEKEALIEGYGTGDGVGESEDNASKNASVCVGGAVGEKASENEGEFCAVKDAKILAQNFAIFKKYISAFKYSSTQLMGDVKEFAVINMPNAYKKAVTSGGDDDLEYLYIDDALIENCYITDFFALYGMIYAVVYNKGQNFMDKEKQSLFGKIAMNTSFAFRSINIYFANLSKKREKRKKQKGS